jgi:hypothetical protein
LTRFRQGWTPIQHLEGACDRPLMTRTSGWYCATSCVTMKCVIVAATRSHTVGALEGCWTVSRSQLRVQLLVARLKTCEKACLPAAHAVGVETWRTLTEKHERVCGAVCATSKAITTQVWYCDLLGVPWGKNLELGRGWKPAACLAQFRLDPFCFLQLVLPGRAQAVGVECFWCAGSMSSQTPCSVCIVMCSNMLLYQH